MNNHDHADGGSAGQRGPWIAAIATVLMLAACAHDEPGAKPQQHAPDSRASNPVAATHALPDYFPAQIPLPDDHLIVRNSSRIADETGCEIALNIALPGSLEKWAKTYRSTLQSEFQAVEFRENPNSLQWRFHGHGFEHAILYLNDNQGYLDRGSVDSSQLPVMLTLLMTERRPSGVGH
jgi:hypothetical protein